MRFGIALVALGLSATAFSQPRNGEIVVTGKKPEQLREEARAFVRSVSATPVSGQFARWREPVCVKTIGLAAQNAAIVSDKVRAVARETKIRLAKPDCETNLLIVFTDNADRDVAALRRTGGRALGKFDPVERRLLHEPGRAARWWYVTRIEGKHGHQADGNTAGLLSAQIAGAAGGPGLVSNGETVAVDGYSSSSVGTHIRAKIEQATFIVDANIASGRTLGAVAAYAALVTLARIRMDSASASDDSILALFSEGAATPDDLTARDRAFLTALYSVPANREAKQQERQIAAAMSKLLQPE